jgi:hypothetical protein
MTDQEGEPIWINVIEMRKTRSSLACQGMVMDFISVLWWPTKEPFAFDPENIADRMNAIFTRREYTAANIRAHERELRRFFVILPDGRWAPDPKFFVLNDPYQEGAGS